MKKKLVLIQFSRAFVPVLVMLFHISVNMKGYWDYNLLGFSYLPFSGGVNYFFALSGFMLFYVYNKKFNQPGNVIDFLYNRVIRIYPLYWILTLMAILVIFLFPSLGVGDNIKWGSALLSIFLLPNPDGAAPILDVAWSLEHTLYFYFIFSLFFFSKIISKVGLFIWSFISLAFIVGLVGSDNYIEYFLFNPYNLIFLGGILSAYLVIHFRVSVKAASFIAFIGFLGFPLTWLNYIYEFVNIDFDIATGLSSVLIIFGLASIDMQVNVKISKVLNYLGNASFAIYLSHNLVLNMLSELFARFNIFEYEGGVLTSIELLILITCAGCIVHSFIEKPIVSFFKKYRFKNTKALTVNSSPEAGV